MEKSINVLVDLEKMATRTGFNVDETDNMELYFAIVHLCILLRDQGVVLEEMFDDILESLEYSDSDEPHGLLN